MGLRALGYSGWVGIKNYPLFWSSSLIIAFGLMSIEDSSLFGESIHRFFMEHLASFIVLLAGAFGLHFRAQFIKTKFIYAAALLLFVLLFDWLIAPFAAVNYREAGALRVVLMVISMLTFGIFFLPHEKIKPHLATYHAGLQIFISSIYAQIIFLGILLAFAGLHLLFGIELFDAVYFRAACIIYLPLNAAILAGNLVELTTEKINSSPGLLFKRLFQYVLIPLTALYVLITSSYIGKSIFSESEEILTITWLSLGYLTFALLTYSIGNLFDEQGELSLPWWNHSIRRTVSTLMALVWVGLVGGIFGRIAEYGYTINRYLLLLFGLWMGLTILLLLVKPRAFRSWVLTLALFAFVGSVGPFSMNSVPVRSQLSRLAEFFPNHETEAARIDDQMTAEKTDEIQNIISYLLNQHLAEEELTAFFQLEEGLLDKNDTDRLSVLATAIGLNLSRKTNELEASDVLLANVNDYTQIGPNLHQLAWLDLRIEDDNVIYEYQINRDDSFASTLVFSRDLSTMQLFPLVSDSSALQKPILEESFLPEIALDLLELRTKKLTTDENIFYRKNFANDSVSIDLNVTWIKVRDEKIIGLTARIFVLFK